jgi:16S rRNA (cytosine967-C5)-methyltransferase
MATETANPRNLALDVLGAVLDRGRPLDEAFSDHPDLARLEPRDRALARNLAATSVRRLGQIDDALARCLDRPLTPKAGRLENVLRLGACQLLFLETPAHAAVDTTVRLAEARGLGRYKGLANAVLRRLGRESAALRDSQDAARLNTPDWLWQSWEQAYGAEVGRQIAEAHLREAPLDLSLKAAAEAPEWAERLDATLLPTGSLRRKTGGGPVDGLAGYEDGAWWVQDAAAALPARLLGDIEGRQVIDLCAAPGGKTAQLVVAGARVTAVDRSPARLARVGANLHRLGLSADLIEADATRWRPPAPVDAVLVDVPCSATGTIRRHPDVAHLKTVGDVASLAAAQHRLLTAAADMLRPGGVVVYCACSLQPDEGPAVVAGVLADGAPLQPAPFAAEEVDGLAGLIDDAGHLRTLPCHWPDEGGMDGFFAARLHRLPGR